MSATLPQMCARLREELDLDEARAKVLVDTACDQIGVDKSGSLVERARAAFPQNEFMTLWGPRVIGWL